MAAETPFRNHVRDWLQAHVPAGWRENMTEATAEAFIVQQREWMKSLVGAGFATSHWSKEWPGGGRPLAEKNIIA
jgi:hypothetical protein